MDHFIKHQLCHASPSHGHGCPECANIINKESKIKGTEKFIEEAIRIHGNKFDYSLVEYANNKQLITVICPVHGNVRIRPNRHLISPTGCMKCSDESTGILSRKSHDDFIKECINKHGDKYDYSQTVYISETVPIEVICKIHGKYSTMPPCHNRKGHGCRKCYVDSRRGKGKRWVRIELFWNSSRGNFNTSNSLFN